MATGSLSTTPVVQSKKAQEELTLDQYKKTAATGTAKKTRKNPVGYWKQYKASQKAPQQAATSLGPVPETAWSSPYASDWNWQKQMDPASITRAGATVGGGQTSLPAYNPQPITMPSPQLVGGSVGNRSGFPMSGTASSWGNVYNPQISRGSLSSAGANQGTSMIASTPPWTGSPFGGQGNSVYGQGQPLGQTPNKNPWVRQGW